MPSLDMFNVAPTTGSAANVLLGRQIAVSADESWVSTAIGIHWSLDVILPCVDECSATLGRQKDQLYLNPTLVAATRDTRTKRGGWVAPFCWYRRNSCFSSTNSGRSLFSICSPSRLNSKARVCSLRFL